MKKLKDPRRMWSSKEDSVNEVEGEMLLDACLSPLDYITVGLPLFCGMRVGEVQHLKATWVDWDKGTITLPARQACSCYECREWRNHQWEPKSKAGIRSLLIDPRLESALGSLGTGINRSRQALEDRFSKILKRSGVARRCYLHALRASFATRLAEQGISAPSLCYIMGWGSLAPAESYIQSSRTRAHQEWKSLQATQSAISAITKGEVQ